MDAELQAQLMEAVSACHLQDVRDLLAAGADPNGVTPLPEIYGEPGDPPHQPTTPLKLVMFRISDPYVDDDDLRRFAEIAAVLIEHGANPAPAMVIAESRYGPYDEQAVGPFAAVWHVVARAASLESS